MAAEVPPQKRHTFCPKKLLFWLGDEEGYDLYHGS